MSYPCCSEGVPLRPPTRPIHGTKAARSARHIGIRAHGGSVEGCTGAADPNGHATWGAGERDRQGPRRSPFSNEIAALPLSPGWVSPSVRVFLGPAATVCGICASPPGGYMPSWRRPGGRPYEPLPEWRRMLRAILAGAEAGGYSTPSSRDKPGFKRRRMHDGFAVKEADVIPAEVQVAVQFESRQATHMGRVVPMAPRHADRHREVVPIQVLVHLDFAFRDFLRQERAARRSPCRQAEAYEQRDCKNALHATGTVCHGSRASRRYPATRALGRRMREVARADDGGRVVTMTRSLPGDAQRSAHLQRTSAWAQG